MEEIQIDEDIELKSKPLGETKEAWDGPEKRLEIKPFTKIRELDKEEQQALQEFLNEPTVEIYYHLNDETDYSVQWMNGSQLCTARVSECVTINGVRWHLLPGKNLVPRSVYEFILSVEDMKNKVTGPQPGVSKNLGLLKF